MCFDGFVKAKVAVNCYELFGGRVFKNRTVICSNCSVDPLMAYSIACGARPLLL